MILERVPAIAVAFAAALMVSQAAAGDQAAAVTESAGDAGSIDWTRGLLIERAAGAANIRAPSAAVARVESHREATKAARERLGARARALVMADGTSVAAAEAANEQIAARLARAIERAVELRAVYSTDGSVMVWVALPLEAVRQAVSGPRVAAEGGHSPVTAIIVDATAVASAPALGMSLALGAEIYQGPTVFVATVQAASTDARLGVRSVSVAAERLENGVLHLVGSTALDERDLAESRATGALVLVVLGR